MSVSNRFVARRSSLGVRGFTLIEIMMAIMISAIIAGAVFFAINTGLDSWGFSKDNLSLQKVMGDVVEKVSRGDFSSYGIRDSLEIIGGGRQRIEFVPPWTDDTHTVTGSETFVYKLNRRIKPGTAVPVAEIKFPDIEEYAYIQIKRADVDKEAQSEILLGIKTPVGSEMKFTYHPDAEDNRDVIQTIWWNSEEKHVYSEYVDEDLRPVQTKLSENALGVEITDFVLRYYDSSNELLSDYEWMSHDDIARVTGIEFYMEAKMGELKTGLLTFMTLRNAPLRLGYWPLEKGGVIDVPDSYAVHTLQLTNFSGINNGDVLDLEFIPKDGDTWRLMLTFRRDEMYGAKIAKYEIEYPVGKVVYTAEPNADVDIGLDLMTLDVSSLYDYDDDQDIEDVVLLAGDVTMEVKQMDIEGVGLFIRP